MPSCHRKRRAATRDSGGRGTAPEQRCDPLRQIVERTVGLANLERTTHLFVNMLHATPQKRG